jgi:hypothetical protein
MSFEISARGDPGSLSPCRAPLSLFRDAQSIASRAALQSPCADMAAAEMHARDNAARRTHMNGLATGYPDRARPVAGGASRQARSIGAV